MEDLINVSVNRKEMPFHWHKWTEINFIIRGSADGVMNNRITQMTEGDIWVVNYEVIHSIENCSDDLLYVQIHLNIESFSRYVPNINTVYFQCYPGECEPAAEELLDEIRGRICAIIGMMSFNTPGIRADNKVIYACIEILNNLKLGFAAIKKGVDGPRVSDNADRIWRVIDYIFDNCNRKLTLKEVADREFITETYLSRILKKETGLNFEETLAYLRAECSIRYLLESDMTITDISYECGFSAPRYYNAAFKKYFSCTPLEYRRKIKNDIRAAEEVSADTLVFRDGTEISEIMPFIRKYSGDTYSIRQIRLKGSLRISSNRLEKHTWRSLLKRRNAYR